MIFNNIILENLSKDFLFDIAILSIKNPTSNEFKHLNKNDFHNPIYFPKYKYWLIEHKLLNYKVFVDLEFNVWVIFRDKNIKVQNQRKISSKFDKYELI